MGVIPPDLTPSAEPYHFLANVNSRSRSLYAIARATGQLGTQPTRHMCVTCDELTTRV